MGSEPMRNFSETCRGEGWADVDATATPPDLSASAPLHSPTHADAGRRFRCHSTVSPSYFFPAFKTRVAERNFTLYFHFLFIQSCTYDVEHYIGSPVGEVMGID